ncbi:hypothetical protein TRVA0_007S02586 [Trichomonascus vanleenenianus]|uniref:Aim19p n=1 Tax=Trichomonascus vanleenenianus TaxID=2268995 RepID=UPI003ECB3C87
MSELPPPSYPQPQTRGIAQAIYNSCETPLPAALAAASLFASYPIAARKPNFRPAKGSILGFGTAFALGGFIIYDGDLTNGAGFASAWSILYLMVNGKPALKSMRPWPVAISGLVAFNAINYGRKFFFPARHPARPPPTLPPV